MITSSTYLAWARSSHHSLPPNPCTFRVRVCVFSVFSSQFTTPPTESSMNSAMTSLTLTLFALALTLKHINTSTTSCVSALTASDLVACPARALLLCVFSTFTIFPVCFTHCAAIRFTHFSTLSALHQPLILPNLQSPRHISII